MSSSGSNSKQQNQSSDRGGVLLVAISIVLLIFGLGMFLGNVMQTSTASLQAFKDLSIGLAGILSLPFSLLIIWLALLCAAASKHSLSFRGILIILGLSVSLMALMTLGTNVPGQGSLLDYVSNVNINYRKCAEPYSLTQYLACAFERYAGRFDGTMTPGGGLFGMLIAFPLWYMLDEIGGLVLVSILMIALGFALFRKNPVVIIQDFRKKRDQASSPAENPVQGEGYDRAELLEKGEAGPESPVYQPFDPRFEAPAQPEWGQDSGTQNDVPPQLVLAPSVLPEFAMPNPGTKPVKAFNRPEPPKEYTDKQQPVASMAGYAEPERRVAVEKTPVFSELEKPVKTDTPGIADPQRAQAVVPPKAEDPFAYPETPISEEIPQKPVLSRPEEESYTKPQTPVTAEARPPRRSETRSYESNLELKKPEPTLPWEEERPAPHREAGGEVHVQPAFELSGKRTAIPVRGNEALDSKSLDGVKRTEKQPMGQQIRFSLDDYQKPPISLLTMAPKEEEMDYSKEDSIRAEKLINTLANFAIPARVEDIVHGPSVTRFAIRLDQKVNVNKVRNITDNLKMELKAKGGIRAEIPIPGTSNIGIEVSNDHVSKVYLSEVLTSARMQEAKSPTTVAIGKDITGCPIVCELMDTPHLLIAGATGSGKSVCINSIISSILFRASPKEVKLILIDPKFVEMQPYNQMPHLLLPVISDPKKATAALEWVCQEMDRRYQLMQEFGVRNLDAYNKKLPPDKEPIPRIILIVDEMADLMQMAKKAVEEHIMRITAKARAAGICLILATQRPSVNIITGVIKANIPSRIAFMVSSPFDSKTILDAQGAEQLMGRGDMLFRANTRDTIRVQGCLVEDRDVEQLTEYISRSCNPEYNADIIAYLEDEDTRKEGDSFVEETNDMEDSFDDLLPEAIRIAVEEEAISISMLQRVLRVGYARAGRMIDEMTKRGIISSSEGTKPRRTLMTRSQYEEYLKQQ